jgi:hypothetical protein
MQNLVNLNDITKQVTFKKGLEFPTIHTNKFRQEFSIPKNLTLEQTVVDSSSDSTTHFKGIHFIKDQILQMPEDFSDFLNMNEYYIFGCDNFLESLLYLLDSDYKLENSSNKQIKLEEFYLRILDKVQTIFSKFKLFYTNNKIKKTKMESDIKSIFAAKEAITFEQKRSVCYFICNLYETNIIILNIDKKIYYNISNNYDTSIILIESESRLLPLNNIYGRQFNQEESKIVLEHFKQKVELKKITNYSLFQLQQLATSNNISTTDNSKKRTKQQLYNDLLLLS